MSAENHENVVTGRFGAQVLTAMPAGGLAAPLEAVVGLGFRALEPRRALVVDAYCDTEAFDLMRAGLSLRLRGTEAGLRIELASLDRAGFEDLEEQRFEVGGPVGDLSRSLDAAGWPDLVRDRVRAAAGDAPVLRVICVLHQRRERYPLVQAEGGESLVVATLELEEVRVFDPRDADGSFAGVARLLEDGNPVGTFTDVEVESVGASGDQALQALSERMRAIPDAVSGGRSKLEQALFQLAERDGIDSETDMAEAGRMMWRRELLVLLLGEAGARRGRDIEYVHEMRVATRRARAIARIFGPHLRRKALRAHLESLKRTARALGAARDADVKLLKLRKYARTRPPEEQAALGEIRAVWRVERVQAQRALVEWLDGPDYRAFVVEFSKLCGTPGMGRRAPKMPDGRVAATRVGHVLPSAILRRFERVRSYAELFDSGAPIPVAALHALRLDCKALRYCLQPVGHLLGDEFVQVLKRLKDLQDILGHLNDAAVADGSLEGLAGVVDPTSLATYRSHQQSVITRLAASAPEAWRALIAPDNRERLAVAIAKL